MPGTSSAQAIASAYVETGCLVRIGGGRRQGTERGGVRDALARTMLRVLGRAGRVPANGRATFRRERLRQQRAVYERFIETPTAL
ncbi:MULTISPECIES: hypothetical protein [unclassified Streptomyces]|uniref:hypothetical protein n=1 Tax=unclassified Streptomyces TaxID=2593676 RepID=UPI002E176D9E|nr:MULTISPECIES: hypothetical protein [unclassified Streptomyces]